MFDVLYGEFIGKCDELYFNLCGVNVFFWFGGGIIVNGVVYLYLMINEFCYNEWGEVVYIDVFGGNVVSEICC